MHPCRCSWEDWSLHDSQSLTQGPRRDDHGHHDDDALHVEVLDERVDRLSARLTAATERTRVEVLDAIERALAEREDPRS